MSIHWIDLGKVALASLGFGGGIIVLFALGVLGASRLETTPSGALRTGIKMAVAASFAVCVAAVLFGLYLIVPQFR